MSAGYDPLLQTSPFSITPVHIYHGFVGSTQQVEIRQKRERRFSVLQLVAQGTQNDKIIQMKKCCNTGTSYCIAPPASLARAYEKTCLAVVKWQWPHFSLCQIFGKLGWGCCFCQYKGLRSADLAPPGDSTPLPKISHS